MPLHVTQNISLDPAALALAGRAWTLQCLLDLQAARAKGRPLPPLVRAGVRYKREPPGREFWQLPTETLNIGSGDCEDLAGWAAAEICMAAGDPHAAVVTFRQSGNHLWHATVKTRDGRAIDPSKMLGMRGPA